MGHIRFETNAYARMWTSKSEKWEDHVVPFGTIFMVNEAQYCDKTKQTISFTAQIKKTTFKFDDVSIDDISMKKVTIKDAKKVYNKKTKTVVAAPVLKAGIFNLDGNKDEAEEEV